MKKPFLVLLLLWLTSPLFAQDKQTISGYVKDSANGESLVGVSFYVQELKTGTTSNTYGFYSLNLPKGNYTLIISYLGYKKTTKRINLTTTNTKLDVEMKDDGEVLQEVIVKTRKEDDNVKSLEMSVNRVEMKTIQKMPALFGEVDVIRSIQFLPGVTTVGEGSSGFNVRGGTVDQNLILLDEAPVFNSSHLFGFFSIFNPDAVKDVTLIKGGAPAQYGGRVSSILDVRMKEGNSKKLSFSGGIGTVFSRFSVEGPLWKDKGSFIVAARRSYIDVLAQPFLNSGNGKGTKAYFYDLTAKGNYKINDKNTIFLSGYFGQDVFGGKEFGFSWGNATGTLRWNHVFSNKLFLNTTTYFSQYNYALNFGNATSDSFNWKSSIFNYSLKPEFTYYITPSNTLNFGGQITKYTFQPGTSTGVSAGVSSGISEGIKYANESAIYVGDEQKVTPKLSLQYGIRYSSFQYLADRSLTLGTPTGKDVARTVIDTLSYSKAKSIQTYGNFEPRFAANLNLNNNNSIKISYDRMSQYLHLLSNTAAPSPLDVWTPSTNNIKPQIADQVALGYFQNFEDNAYEASVEVYYKQMQNQIQYTTGSQLLLNPYVEAELLFGKGRAYGAEFYVKKNKGKVTGWVSYTLSRTENLINGLNNNQWFRGNVDRPHNLSLVAIYNRNARWSFSANFVYLSGTPASFPTDKYIIQGIALPNNYNNSRNTYRIPSTNRLDLSATKVCKKRLFGMKGEMVYSIYNVYDRKNPFSEYVQPNPDNQTQTQAIKYSVFGSFLPAITYNFKF